jgi:hypothetical protein
LKTIRSLLKTLCQCIGFSSLILLADYADLLGGGANVRFHAPLPLGGIATAQIVDIALLSVGLFALLSPLRWTRFYPAVQLLLAALAPPIILWRVGALLPFGMPLGLAAGITLAWSAILLTLMLRSPGAYRRTIRFGSTLGVFFALFALLSVLQLLWLASWKPGPQQHSATWASAQQPSREHPLLVWVLFDELSYQQTFEHRAHDLALPHFDALRDESTLFTDVQPAGYKTAVVVPSLLSGEPVTALRFGWDNRLQVHAEGIRGFHPLAGGGTVFADAQRNGWRTATVGWYNPYCSIYGDAIDDCYWANWDMLDGPMAQHDSLSQNIQTPLRRLIHKSRSADRDLCNYDVQHRLQTHIDLEQHALQLLRTDQADFVFLHLAVPHSPNIWSRMNDSYTDHCGGSYLDNLALADRELGKIMTLLTSSPRWKDTTLIVEGDHGWRVKLWTDGASWTQEDDAASHGVFDPRPALLIHQAGQTQAQIHTTAWPLLRVHNVVDAVLRGEAIRY